MQRIEMAPGAFITDIPGEKFKRSKIVFHLIAPGQRKSATELALLPSVLERRCEAIPDPTALSKRLFDLYGAELSSDSYTLGANRVLSLSVGGLKDQYALAGEKLSEEFLALACDLLFSPKLEKGGFLTEDVEIEKIKQADYLKSEMNDKRSYCVRQARRKLYGDTAQGIESGGYLEELPAVTSKALYKDYQRFVKGAQLEIMASGLDIEAAAEAIARRLEKLGRSPENPADTPAVDNAGKFRHFSEAMDTAQGKLCLLFPSGHRASTEGEAVMRVGNAVLGGLPTSRLFTNVREKQSLCYYCSSSYGSFSGVLSIDSGVDHKDADRARDAILKELEALQKQPVTGEELGFAHLALRNSFEAAKDHLDALINWAFLERMRGTDLTLDQAGEQIEKVTADQVQQALAAFAPRVEYRITGKEAAQ